MAKVLVFGLCYCVVKDHDLRSAVHNLRGRRHIVRHYLKCLGVRKIVLEFSLHSGDGTILFIGIVTSALLLLGVYSRATS